MSWNPKYALLMALSTGITWLTGYMLERCADKRRKLIWLTGSLVSNLGILCIFKYANFFLDNIYKIFAYLGIEVIERRLDLLLPVGISFYTFQALSYTIDVYRGEIRAEKNIFRYALFVSFFPQLVAGPIERSGNLLGQIQNVEKIKVWNFERVRDGFLLMMWGLFQKLVIADRASLLVDTVINDYEKYGFVEIAVAAILFAFQIYCDFGGYTNIARGAAKVMGFKLMNNFRQPYFAKSIKDFWRRWHISLTSWFTDYLYIPLGGNRKGVIRKYLNTLIVFGVSGLWHGASWNFIVWGLLHAVYQIVGDFKDSLLKEDYSKGVGISARIFGVWQSAVTFLLVDFAWIFFVCGSCSQALRIIRRMFEITHTTSIFDIGLNQGNWIVLIVAILILSCVDILHEYGVGMFALVNKQCMVIRWGLYLGLVLSIIMFGIYGVTYDAGAFIYFQF